jgi:putative transposase
MDRFQAYKYELKPNNKQRGDLYSHAGASRFAWNWGLARRIHRFENNEGKDKFTTAINQHKELCKLKKDELAWMYSVSKCSPQESLRDLDKAFKQFWKRRKEGVGFPKFKKKGKCRDSFRLTGSIKVFEKYIQLPRIGKMCTKESTDKFDGRILSATVSREADRWFVSLQVKREVDTPEKNTNCAIGIDLGIKTFTMDSDGNYSNAPKSYAKSLKLLKKRQKQHSRKKKGSNNRKKSAMKLARLHRKIKSRRNDFLHKLSTYYAKSHGVICVEDLNVKGMVRNRKLSKQISDSGWGDFIRMLEYKAEWYGSTLVKIGRFFPSSKICSECGVINEGLTLSDRIWVCTACDMEHERDENAARNILIEGLKILSTASSAGSDACGDTSGGGVSFTPSHVLMKQEESTIIQ